MQRNKVLRKLAVFGLIAAFVALTVTGPVWAQPRPMTEDVFTPLALGYDFMRDGKYEAAEFEFKKALKADNTNPFVLNNLAALEERKGNLDQAYAYLSGANQYASQYKNKVQQTCFVGGMCAAVKPIKEVGPESTIAPIIAENMNKLKAKMGGKPSLPVGVPKMK